MSLFNLKTKDIQLASANAGQTRLAYEQVTATRDVSEASFPNGNIHYRFATGGNKWWIPSRSYLRARVQYSKANGDQLDAASNVAPAMNPLSGLFQACEFRIMEKTVSRVPNFVAQVDSLRVRSSKSKAWMDSLGASTSLWQAEAKSREAVVAGGMYSLIPDAAIRVAQSRDDLGVAATTTVAFVAATGVITFAAPVPTNLADLFPVGSQFVFSSPGPYVNAAAGNLNKPMEVAEVDQGAGTITLVVAGVAGLADEGAAILNFSRYIGEDMAERPSRGSKSLELIWQPPLSIFDYPGALPAGKYELILTPQVATAYKKFAIESLGANKAPGVDYDFKVIELTLYNAVIDGPDAPSSDYMIELNQTRCQSEQLSSAAFSQKFFEVSPSTRAVAFALQDSQATSAGDTRYTAAKFKASGDQDRNITRFFYQYAGLSQPSPDSEPTYDAAAATDYTAQRYAETQIYNGAWFDSGAGESIEDWDARGRYYMFKTPRSANDRSTRLQVHTQLSAAPVNLNLLCFDISSEVAVIKVQNGMISEVQVEAV